MADMQGSKSSKRNRKRRKAQGPETLGPEHTKGAIPCTEEEEEEVKKLVDPQTSIKQQLEEAKFAKDHDRAQELRQQLWKLQDSPCSETVVLPKVITNTPQASPFGADPTDKKLVKLKKKLQAIKLLKERGEKLEANQLAKIKTESDIIEEIEIVEELLQGTQLR